MTSLNITTSFEENKSREDIDVCIIGTGAGGAVVGYHLAKEGLKVLMLEKGDYYSHEQINSEKREEVLVKLFKNDGIQVTRLPLLAIAQGECVGGSTVINYGICFRIPDGTFNLWKSQQDIQFSLDDLNKEYDEVEKQIHVRPITNAGLSHEMMKLGCDRLHLSGGWMNKNYVDDGEKIKQNVIISYLEKSPSENLEIYANCKVEKIIKKKNSITEVIATHTNTTGKTVTIRIRPKIVVLSAGAIASSELLLKNNLANSSGQVGKNLSFHPASSMIAVFDHKINGQNDISMAYHCDEFSIIKKNEPGVMIESIFISPAQLSAATPDIGEKNAKFLEEYDNTAMAGILVQDEPTGTVSLNWNKDAIVDYILSDSDAKKLLEGMKMTARIYFEAGATQVISGHVQRLVLESIEDIHLMDERGTQLGTFRTASAHPQGGNRMGNDKKNTVVDSYCHCHDVKNLYVCDASVFPTSLGVNPQFTVMAIASLAAKKIIQEKDKIFNKRK